MAVHPRAAELIAKLGLEPHPEGGFYREIFRSSARVTPADGRDARVALTTIYFLLVEGTHSRWHQVASDEVWHLYEGSALELFELDLPSRHVERHRLAPAADGVPVHTIAGGRWQAARPVGPYALAGCTVGPGFDFADFRMLADHPNEAAVLRASWPELSTLL